MHDQLLAIFKDLGIKIQDGKVLRADLQKVLGANYEQPEWLQAADFNLRVPVEYCANLKEDEDKYGRVANPATFSIARYGKFLDSKGVLVTVDGLVYAYSRVTNPRNIGWGYKIFCNGHCVAKNSSVRSPQEAKLGCDQDAGSVLSTLFDAS